MQIKVVYPSIVADISNNRRVESKSIRIWLQE